MGGTRDRGAEGLCARSLGGQGLQGTRGLGPQGARGQDFSC